MATLGEFLLEERKKAGLTLEKTAGILRVGKDYLINVEQDYYEELPPDVYIKGFLRNYAKLLELDEDEVIAIYQQQKKITKQGPRIKKEKKKWRNLIPRFVITPELFIGGALILVVSAIVIYFFRVAENFSELPVLEITEPLENKTVENERLKIAGKASQESVLKINGQEIGLDDQGMFATEITLMGGINEIEVRAENKFGKVIEKKITVNYELAQAVVDIAPKNKIIHLKTDSEPIWLEVKDSSNNFSETLAAHSEKTLEIKEATTVIVSKANGIYFTEDQEDLKIFGETNERAERVFRP
ncbi:MAG: helix-turn-helix domain-containing protein [Patescibacteria group bacterium]|nr:helix-turn-helix domain-containing protein [Patescibacteria group bacterium]